MIPWGILCINLNRDAHLFEDIFGLPKKKITGFKFQAQTEITAFLFEKTNIILVLQVRRVVSFEYKIELNQLSSQKIIKINPVESISRN